MSKNVIFEIQDSVSLAREALKKAQVVYEEIEMDFFVEAANHGTTVVMMTLPRYQTFSAILGDLLNEIEMHLPSNEWFEEQKEKCGNERD